jgi:hypothetical protein
VFHTEKKRSCLQAKENICGFCLLNYYSEKSAEEGNWTDCRVCRTWYHEIFVAAVRKKSFIYEKFV